MLRHGHWRQSAVLTAAIIGGADLVSHELQAQHAYTTNLYAATAYLGDRPKLFLE